MGTLYRTLIMTFGMHKSAGASQPNEGANVQRRIIRCKSGRNGNGIRSRSDEVGAYQLLTAKPELRHGTLASPRYTQTTEFQENWAAAFSTTWRKRIGSQRPKCEGAALSRISKWLQLLTDQVVMLGGRSEKFRKTSHSLAKSRIYNRTNC